MGHVKQTSGPGDAILRKLIEASRKQGKVGWFETAKYEDGTPVAYVAAIQENGSPAQGIPPRPFLRTTIAARQAAWRDLIHSGAQRILDGKASVADVLNIVGLRAADRRHLRRRLDGAWLARWPGRGRAEGRGGHHPSPTDRGGPGDRAQRRPGGAADGQGSCRPTRPDRPGG